MYKSRVLLCEVPKLLSGLFTFSLQTGCSCVNFSSSVGNIFVLINLKDSNRTRPYGLLNIWDLPGLLKSGFSEIVTVVQAPGNLQFQIYDTAGSIC